MVQESVVRWSAFVQDFVAAYEHGERLSGGQTLLPPICAGAAGFPVAPGQHKVPRVMLCSPHPDDEILTGVLPLRLLREQGAWVCNLAVTLGSDPARQGGRWSELLAACAVVGFECRRLWQPSGFDLKAGPEGEAWMAVVEGLADCLAQLNPGLVFFPHAHDAHPAHIATNRLVSAALAMWTAACPVTVKAVETEYWSTMSAPNLLVGVAPEDLARLLAALACHRGEIVRNPYHLTHPARLMDTVRRGAELVQAMTPARPGFLFGELYRLSVWRQGQKLTSPLRPACLAPGHGLAGILAD